MICTAPKSRRIGAKITNLQHSLKVLPCLLHFGPAEVFTCLWQWNVNFSESTFGLVLWELRMTALYDSLTCSVLAMPCRAELKIKLKAYNEHFAADSKQQIRVQNVSIAKSFFIHVTCTVLTETNQFEQGWAYRYINYLTCSLCQLIWFLWRKSSAILPDDQVRLCDCRLWSSTCVMIIANFSRLLTVVHIASSHSSAGCMALPQSENYINNFLFCSTGVFQDNCRLGSIHQRRTFGDGWSTCCPNQQHQNTKRIEFKEIISNKIFSFSTLAW